MNKVWGTPVNLIPNNLRFPGQYFDAETGLHQNWHRDYVPWLGRYVEPDPIGVNGELNLYAYALDNPIFNIDPLGLDMWIEGPSKGEPRLHISLCIGDPKGENDCYSFGFDVFWGKDSIFEGVVYEEPPEDKCGEILSSYYLRMSKKEDAIAKFQIIRLIARETRGPYGPWSNCRNWTFYMFSDLQESGLGRPAIPLPPLRTCPQSRGTTKPPALLSSSKTDSHRP